MRLLAAVLAFTVSSTSAIALARSSNPSPNVSLRELGTPFPNGFSRPYAINDRGEVVGVVEYPIGNGIHDNAPFHWSPKGGFNLFLGARHAFPLDINNHGQVVGSSDDGGFVWDATHGVVELGSFRPVAINEKGDMVGTCDNGTPCVVIAGTTTFIDVPDALGVSPADINDRREVVGTLNSPTLGIRAFVWTATDGVRLLEPPNGFRESWGLRINDRGVAVGVVTHDFEFSPLYAAKWRSTTAILVEPGQPVYVGLDINNHGTVLVQEVDGATSTAAVVTSDGTRVVLSPEVPESIPYRINNRGQIIGAIFDQDGFRGVIWTLHKPSSRSLTPDSSSR